MTKLFSSSSITIPKSGLLGLRFRHFCVFVKFCNQTNSRVLISNLTIVLLKFLPKNTQIRHSWSKIPKNGIFSPKFGHFCFSAKFCNQINSRVLISNMTIVFFFKFLPKNSKIRHFWSKIQKNVIFGPKFRQFGFFTKFCNRTNSKVLISNMTKVFFKFQPKNTLIRHFWSQIQAFSLFHEILQLDKFKGADFKYGNIIFKFQSQNTEI